MTRPHATLVWAAAAGVAMAGTSWFILERLNESGTANKKPSAHDIIFDWRLSSSSEVAAKTEPAEIKNIVPASSLAIVVPAQSL